MTLEQRIQQAEANAVHCAEAAQAAADELLGAEALGLIPSKLESLQDLEKLQTQRAAVWSATARKLREQRWTEGARAGGYPEGWSVADQEGRQLAADRYRRSKSYAYNLECEALAMDLLGSSLRRQLKS